MTKNTSVRDEIFAKYESFFDAERRVADCVINNHSQVVEMSVSELAGKCETSQATVMRFCKKIGCSGFYQMKLRMAGELRGQEQLTTSAEISCDNMQQSLHNILSSKIEELRSTFQSFEAVKMQELISCILGAGIVEFAAMGNTVPIAMDGVYKFNQLGLRAVGSPIWETQEATARNLRKGDMLFAISASGASRRLLRMVEIARENSVTTVAITNRIQSPIAERCDYVIRTAVRESLFCGQVTFSRMSAMAVIDTLFLLLFSVKGGSYDNLSRHEQSVAEEKV